VKVLLLSPYPERLADILRDDDVVPLVSKIHWPNVDFVISYGHREIIREPYLSEYKGRIINIHLSLLPWNRGADPNFWAWFDNTPHGVSIHHMDDGIDSGPIIFNGTVDMTLDPIGTLESSYGILQNHAVYLFGILWENFKYKGKLPRGRPNEGGTYHRSKDKEQWMARFPLGWKTPVADVMALGRKANGR
jgi:methionyl-tRNA formyltransferase